MNSTLTQEKITYKVEKLDYADIPQLSKKDKRYIKEDESLRPFYKYSPNIDSFEQVFDDKDFSQESRNLLSQVLKDQYENLKINSDSLVWKTIEELKDENTYTVITAHQPSLFTGPLYYVIKIFSTINLAKQLNERFPDKKVIPLFISGGEDHDFEEVNHANLFGKSIQWQNEEEGSVGMMKTDSLSTPLDELFQILGDSENALKLKEVFENSYKKFGKYSDAVAAMVHHLFGDYGLLVLNMNNKKLKGQFAEIIKEEVLNEATSEIVRSTISKLEKVDYPNQAYVRDINFFYMKDQLRNRIEASESGFKVVDTDLTFTKAQMISEIENHPERFSPNVVMRPIFQEFSIPNLAYVGGGGEIAYWLERKEQFEYYDINFPMLVRRNSVLWIDGGAHKKMGKFNFSISEIFSETDSLIKKLVLESSEEELNLTAENQKLNSIFEEISKKADSIDKGLKNYIEAEKTKQQKVLKNIEAKLIRAEKQKYEVSNNQITKLKGKLFPKDSLQERYENFIPFYLKYGEEFFEVLKNELNPLDKRFTVIIA